VGGFATGAGASPRAASQARGRRIRLLWRAALGFWLGLAASASAAPDSRAGETVGQALCRLVETSAQARALPVPFLTRLIWQESSFRTTAVSRAGAQGVAQFMPGTAQERGLADPFDPEQAIPAAAHLLSDLRAQFGNLGLAAAAYNGGPNRVAAWLAGNGGLPAETRDYVARITGRSAEEWRGGREASAVSTRSEEPPQSCLQVTASLKSLRGPATAAATEGPLAPWGVQLSGNFSKSIALASFARARQAYNAILGETQPMVIGTRLRTRGARTYYRVRVGAATRQAANTLCNRIRGIGGACVVLPS
jgi:hypothetical protein